MNIKRAIEVIEKYPFANILNKQMLTAMLEALGEPNEPISTFVEAGLREQLRQQESIIEQLKETNQILNKKLNGYKNHVFSGFVSREEYDQANHAIIALQKKVENLESTLRVEGYRIEVKDAKINHLRTVLKVNGITMENEL